jgi:hypothetical protein
MDVAYRTMKWMRNIYKILVGKPEGKRLGGRPRCRWEDNIRMDLRGIGWEGVDWMHLAEDSNKWRALLNLQELKKGGTFLKI